MKGLCAALVEVILSQKDVIMIDPEIVVRNIGRRRQFNLVFEVLIASENLLFRNMVLERRVNRGLGVSVDICGKVISNRYTNLGM